MATKGKNKNGLRRKVRSTTKRVDRDIGAHGNSRMIYSGYKSGVSPGDYPKLDDSVDIFDEEERGYWKEREREADRIDGYDRDDLGEVRIGKMTLTHEQEQTIKDAEGIAEVILASSNEYNARGAAYLIKDLIEILEKYLKRQ